VAYRNENFSHVLLEASGNITGENIKLYAQTGVDAISSGSLIHQAVWLDFSMRITHKE
jgi:nicotinate-nucleotide pyrophosphorylase (carboxylating)